MNVKDRKLKYGQFGYGKYVYPKESLDEIKQFFIKGIEELFSSKELNILHECFYSIKSKQTSMVVYT